MGHPACNGGNRHTDWSHHEHTPPLLATSSIDQVSIETAAPKLTERITAIDAAGFTQIVFSILPGQERAFEDCGRIRRAFAGPRSPAKHAQQNI